MKGFQTGYVNNMSQICLQLKTKDVRPDTVLAEGSVVPSIFYGLLLCMRWRVCCQLLCRVSQCFGDGTVGLVSRRLVCTATRKGITEAFLLAWEAENICQNSACSKMVRQITVLLINHTDQDRKKHFFSCSFSPFKDELYRINHTQLLSFMSERI